jgi:hypothetical protein
MKMENKDALQQEAENVNHNSIADEYVKKALAATERLEIENRKFEQNIARLEALKVEKLIAGNSDAAVEQKLDETPEEYAKRVLRNEI